MSEVDELEPEVAEAEAPEVNPIEDLINTVTTQDFSKAAPTFAEIMQSKIDDALEQEKIAVADQVFNGAQPEEDEEVSDEKAAELDDITDEEIDDAIDETDEELTEYEFG